MKCDVCAIGCQMKEGGRGACGKYELINGEIAELYPDRYLMVCPISIETMPMLHFYPGGKFLQISTTGCNFDCPGCVSTVIVKEIKHNSAALRHLTPEQVVTEAMAQDCLGIALLMNDPLASFQSFLGVARCAREHGLLAGFSSNGYFSPASLEKIMPWLDFVNIGVKGIDDASYRRCGAPCARPVFDNIERLHAGGVHVEVSCMYARGGRREVIQLAHRLAAVSETIPLHIMRFIPLEQTGPETEASIREAEELQRELLGILKHVYLFNSPGTRGLDSYCPDCGRRLYQRDFYGPMGARLRSLPEELPESSACPDCGRELNIRGPGRRSPFQEAPFQGGYPFTRALELLESMLLAMGVTDKGRVVDVWEDVLINRRLEELHHDAQNLAASLDIMRHCGDIAGCSEKARELIIYVRGKLHEVMEIRRQAKQNPRVYYAMGKPLFCIMGGRMENQLVEAAGGHSVNRELKISGRPGASITPAQLNALNPEVIFISAFISSSVKDFCQSCREEGIDVEALRNGRVYCHPSPGWDFGSPRWILGLMYISNVLFPETACFDIMAEAQEFYRRFYGLDFAGSSINRSFGKPAVQWRWQPEKETDYEQSGSEI